MGRRHSTEKVGESYRWAPHTTRCIQRATSTYIQFPPVASDLTRRRPVSRVAPSLAGSPATSEMPLTGVGSAPAIDRTTAQVNTSSLQRPFPFTRVQRLCHTCAHSLTDMRRTLSPTIRAATLALVVFIAMASHVAADDEDDDVVVRPRTPTVGRTGSRSRTHTPRTWFVTPAPARTPLRPLVCP
jgi:hypothetical protein